MKSIIRLNNEEIREILARAFNTKITNIGLCTDSSNSVNAEICVEEKPVKDYMKGVNAES